MSKENKPNPEVKTKTSELFEKGNYKKKESKKKLKKEEQEEKVDFFNDRVTKTKPEKKKSTMNTINKIIVWTLITGLLGSTILTSLLLMF